MPAIPPASCRPCASAAERGVVVGAHVSYPDLAGFGRRDMDVASADLVADVIYQIGALKGLAAAAGTTVRYVKPHGALYNTIAHDERQARDVIAAIRAVDASLVLVGLAGSPLLGWAQASGLRTVAEAFADRAYTPQGTLVSRREKGACCTMRTRWRHACCAWRRKAWSRPSTAARCASRPNRSACTATAPVRSRWRGQCARCSSARA